MRHCYVLRVFTRDETTGGNHLGVVTDVTGLPERVMQQIAADLGFSETVYIDWRQEGSPRVRIFTPEIELPFAGHPLVGAAWLLSSLGPGTATSVMCDVGEIPFRMEGAACWVDTPLVTDVTAAPEVITAAGEVGLGSASAAWWARMPWPYLIVDLGSPDAVAAVTPDIAALTERGMDAAYVFARQGDRVKARFFAPFGGIPEDPATGSAAAALAAVLAHDGEEAGSLTVTQGDEIGAPSTIELSWDGSHASLGGLVVRDEVRVLEA